MLVLVDGRWGGPHGTCNQRPVQLHDAGGPEAEARAHAHMLPACRAMLGWMHNVEGVPLDELTLQVRPI